MAKKRSRLEEAQAKAQKAIESVNKKINDLGEHAGKLYTEINFVQEMIDNIRNIPTKDYVEFEKLKEVRSNWKNQTELIEKEYKEEYITEIGAATIGTSLGVAIATLGPTAAMGAATAFGVASTGTAIATLHGAAATSAALAWLGGGTLAVGGGGIAVGKALLTLAGPVGWVIAGAAFVASGVAIVINQNNKKELENAFALISERDVHSYELASVEINERIKLIKEKSIELHRAILSMQSFGLDYKKMSEDQQYELGSFVNLVLYTTQLLTNPIIGLLPKYTENDYDEFCKSSLINNMNILDNSENLIITLCNLFYKVDTNEKTRKLLWESLRNNKEFLKSFEMKKQEFKYEILETVQLALDYKQQFSN